MWLAERPFYPRLPGLQGTDVACKAAVVRLPDGKLWVHAPVGLDIGAKSPAEIALSIMAQITERLRKAA